MAMKFRDPKTGEVFEDIDTAIWNDCRQCDTCDAYCALFDTCKSSACHDYVISHPTEAARRMGYEVLENHSGDTTEKVMPRICQVLGVEVGERFRVESCCESEFWVEDGALQCEAKSPLSWSQDTANLISVLLDEPEFIIRKPRFTEDEIALAGILHRQGVTELFRKEGYSLHWRGGKGFGQLPLGLFSSIKVGDTVEVEEIIRDQR